MASELFMVFNVEAIGLHGEGFAVGWVVIDEHGKEYGHGIAGAPLVDPLGTLDDFAWVNQNIPELPWRSTLREVRTALWDAWLYWRGQSPKAVLVADCAWPVEARFLIACVDDDPNRKQTGPYPLHELASFLMAAGMDPTGDYGRKENELPKHNPLADARQSARVLTTALRKIRGDAP